MRKLILSALILSMLLVVTSCGEESSAPMGFKEISDEALTYHLYVPDEWTTDVSTGMTSAYFNGRDPSNISMTAFEIDMSITSIDDYWALYEADFKEILTDMEYVDVSDCTLDGVAAKQYTYTATLSGDAYKFMQIVAIDNNQVYIFTYTALLDKYDSHIEDVIAILDYLDLK